MMEKQELDEGKAKSDRRSVQIKILLWLVGLILAGSAVCLILGILRTLFVTLVIVAAVVLLVGLIGSYMYERTKWKIDEARYQSQRKKLEKKLEDSDYHDV